MYQIRQAESFGLRPCTTIPGVLEVIVALFVFSLSHPVAQLRAQGQEVLHDQLVAASDRRDTYDQGLNAKWILFCRDMKAGKIDHLQFSVLFCKEVEVRTRVECPLWFKEGLATLRDPSLDDNTIKPKVPPLSRDGQTVFDLKARIQFQLPNAFRCSRHIYGATIGQETFFVGTGPDFISTDLGMRFDQGRFRTFDIFKVCPGIAEYSETTRDSAVIFAPACVSFVKNMDGNLVMHGYACERLFLAEFDIRLGIPLLSFCVFSADDENPCIDCREFPVPMAYAH